MRGVNAPELRTQIDILLLEAFPRELCHLLAIHHLTRVARLSSRTFITVSTLSGGRVNRADHVQDNCFSRCCGQQTVSFH
jgi:hypothetical protein